MNSRIVFAGALALLVAGLSHAAPPPAGPLRPVPGDAASAPARAGETTARALPAPASSKSPLPEPITIESPEGISGPQYGQSLTTIGDLYGDGYSDFVIGSPYAIGPLGYQGAVYPFNADASGFTGKNPIYGPKEYSGFGASVSTAGDVNGDGRQDLLVGAPYLSNTESGEGRATLYLGTPFGISASPAWLYESNVVGTYAGYAVSFVGDLNGDGYDDWAVGAPGWTNTELNEGAVLVFAGGPGALSTVPVRVLESNIPGALLGSSVSTAGDVNADGFDDLIAGAPSRDGTFTDEGSAFLWLGKATFPNTAPSRQFDGSADRGAFGQSVTVIGDANGDGYSDFAISEPRYQAGIQDGRVHPVYGGPIPALYTTASPINAFESGEAFGWSISSAGDFNADGYADLLVGAPYATGDQPRAGAAYVLPGGPNGIHAPALRTYLGPRQFMNFGFGVATAGDFNADGRSDVLVGAPFDNASTGSAYEFPGEVTPLTLYEHIPGQSGVAGEYWGQASASGDWNGDGADDMAIGDVNAPGSTSAEGAFDVYYGGPDVLEAPNPFPLLCNPPDFHDGSGATNSGFGFAMSNAGDVNGDGYDDLIVGAYAFSNGESSEGEAVLYYGSVNGLTTENRWQTEGNAVDAYYGYSVTGNGDLNGDGYADVAVGAYNLDAGGGNFGVVKVFLGSAAGLSHVPWKVLGASASEGAFGLNVCIVGDVNGDGLDDLAVGAPYSSNPETFEGRILLYYGSKTDLLAIPPTVLERDSELAQFGSVIRPAGDVNSDGYADVAVGSPGMTVNFTNQGRIDIFPGSSGGLSNSSLWGREGDGAYEYLGGQPNSFGSGGDFNGDGATDFLVGSPYHSGTAGRVSMFAAGPSGLALVPFVDLFAGGGDYYVGYTTIGNADYDGDGATDLVWTSPGFGYVGAHEGVVSVVPGNSLDYASNPFRPMVAQRPDGSARIGTGLRSSSNTSFRIAGLGRTAAGRSRTRLQWEVKSGRNPFTLAGLVGQGPWVRTGPVVPGDGSTLPMNALVAGLSPATSYRWRARWQSHSPYFPTSPWFSPFSNGVFERDLWSGGAPLAVGVDPAAPASFALLTAAPNPSTDTASLGFTLPARGHATLALYDVTGRRVRTLFDGDAPAGRTDLSWDGRDDSGRRVPAGAYFARVLSGAEEKVGKVVRL